MPDYYLPSATHMLIAGPTILNVCPAAHSLQVGKEQTVGQHQSDALGAALRQVLDHRALSSQLA